MESDDLNKITNDLKSHDNLLITSVGLALGLSFFSRRLSCVSAGFGGFMHGKRSTLLEQQKTLFEQSQKNSNKQQANPYRFLNSDAADNTINFMSKTSTGLLSAYEKSPLKITIDKLVEEATSPKKP